MGTCRTSILPVTALVMSAVLNETIAIYAIIDDLLKAIGHREDIRCQMSDAKIITTANVG